MAKQTFTTGQVLTAAQMTSLQQTAMGGGSATAKTASYVLVAADAGTTVAMNAAGSTTITVNTGLFSAGDTVFIQNLGAGACTITAGTATVSTAGSLILPQYDAGILYFTSASAAIFYDYIQTGATSPLTTKGDIWGYSTSDARIPIGTNGDVLTADSTQTLGLKWAAPASALTFVGCSVYKSSAQTLTNNTETALTFDTENFDTNTFHSTSTNTSRMTIPSGKAGYYLVVTTVSFASNSTPARAVTLRKNGSEHAYLQQLQPVNGGGSTTNGSYILNLAENDYIEIYVRQESGGNLNTGSGSTGPSFTIQYLGA